MFILWYLLYALIVISAVCIFLPSGIGGGLHNIPIFIALLTILLAIFLIKCIRYIRLFQDAKKHLIECGYSIKKLRLLPPFIGKRYNIVAKNDSKTINLYVLRTNKRYSKYYFADISTIELYKSTRLAIKPSVGQANIISNHVETKKVATKHLSWNLGENQNETNIILFDKIPDCIVDGANKEWLDIGDKICDSVYLYDLDGFIKHSF